MAINCKKITQKVRKNKMLTKSSQLKGDLILFLGYNVNIIEFRKELKW